ncbi:MAG: DUF6088 family protein [Prevotellaceae bacterium]|jgi:hypothetical protein|nr:DUF6088 family protein [Prevotellaceae bacterium]
MQSVHGKIETKIKRRGRGRIIFSSDFFSYGTNLSVRHTLSRLCQKGLIVRLSAGIYLYPKIDDELGILYPSILDIAREIAKREKARLVPTGLYALNRLGLSTQVPAKAIFLTDGSPRTIKIGEKAILKFRKTAAKNLAFTGKITQLVCFALKEIGKDMVEEEQLERIGKALSFESDSTIEHDAALAPEWIAKIMLKFRHGE